MSEIQWIKIVTDFFDDEKIRLIESMPDADMILIIWIKLLTLAGKKNMHGYIFLTENIPYTDEMLSTIFKRPINTIRLALDVFKKFGMIDYDKNEVIKITNWEKHQNIEGMKKIKEQTRLRVERFRKREKPLPKLEGSVTSNGGNDLEKRRVEKSREDKKRVEKKSKYMDVVFLTSNEYNKLVKELGKELTEEYIKDLSLYIQSKGKRYKSHYATILTWNRKDIREGKIRKPVSIKEKVKNDDYDWEGAMDGK